MYLYGNQILNGLDDNSDIHDHGGGDDHDGDDDGLVCTFYTLCVELKLRSK